jgi:hypothetical protein
MTSTGTALRILGAAILLIAVQFASIAAQAHIGHSHGPDGQALQAQGPQPQPHAHGAAAGAAHSLAADETGSAHRITPPAGQSRRAAQAATAAQDMPGAAAGSNTCVIGCCGTGMGCCAAALAAVAPKLPPKAGSPRIGFMRLVSVREVDPRGLRKPPRSLT